MATEYLTSDGDTLDFICWKFYGQQSGAVELVLEANRDIADRGPLLPAGLKVILPDMPKPATEVQPLRLWG